MTSLTSASGSLPPPSALNSTEAKRELAALLTERKRRFDRTRLTRYQPYPKQEAFHSAGLTHRERLLMAGNQLGKTYSGAAELILPSDRQLSVMVERPHLRPSYSILGGF
jgi:hypothetical protein